MSGRTQSRGNVSANPQSGKRKFIVLKQHSGRGLEVDGAGAAAYIDVLPGEIFEELFVTDDTQVGNERISLISLERNNVISEADVNDVLEIGSFAASLLLSVSDHRKRVELLDKNRLNDAFMLDVDTPVTVILNTTPRLPVPGVVRYQGKIEGRGDGIWFGVDLTEHFNYGDSDGSVCGRYYFRCPKNSGVFVTIADLFLRDTTPEDIKPSLQTINSLENTRKTDQNWNQSSPPQVRTNPVHSKDVNHGITSTLQKAARNIVDNISNVVKGGTSSTFRTESTGSQVFTNTSLQSATGSLKNSNSSVQFNGPMKNSSRFTMNHSESRAVAARVDEDLPIKLSSRVVHYMDGGAPQLGTVRWIGRMGNLNEIIAGVEFVSFYKTFIFLDFLK